MTGNIFDDMRLRSPEGLLSRSHAACRPMRLSREWRVTSRGAEVVADCLSGGCACGHDIATLKKRRNSANARLVVIQCDMCGANLANGVKRLDHPEWESYPEWDGEKRTRYWALWHAQSDERQKQWLAQKREENGAFYQSNAWRELRDSVLANANYHCGMCGRWPAHTAHHTTYAHGLDCPPEYLLAVCDPCHKRLHTRGDPWHNPALPAHYSVKDWWEA